MNNTTAPKKSITRRVLTIVGITFAFFATFIVGGMVTLAGANVEPTAAPEPETITKTVEAEPEVITKTKEVKVPVEKVVEKEVEVEVEVADPSCAKALDYSDELIGYFGEAIESAADSIGYATSFDWDALDAETAKLDELTPKITDARTNYDAESATCRAAEDAS